MPEEITKAGLFFANLLIIVKFPKNFHSREKKPPGFLLFPYAMPFSFTALKPTKNLPSTMIVTFKVDNLLNDD